MPPFNFCDERPYGASRHNVIGLSECNQTRDRRQGDPLAKRTKARATNLIGLFRIISDYEVIILIVHEQKTIRAFHVLSLRTSRCFGRSFCEGELP